MNKHTGEIVALSSLITIASLPSKSCTRCWGKGWTHRDGNDVVVLCACVKPRVPSGRVATANDKKS